MSIVDNIKIKQQFGEKYEFQDLSEYETRSGFTKFAELPEKFKDFTITNISKAGRVCAVKDDTTLYFDMIDGKLILKRYSYKDAEKYFNKIADKKKLIIKLDITEFDKRIMDSVIDVYDGKVLRTNWLNDTVDDATQMTRTDISELEDKFDEIIRKLKHEITYKD